MFKATLRIKRNLTYIRKKQTLLLAETKMEKCFGKLNSEGVVYQSQ